MIGLPCVGDCLVFQRMLTTVSRDFHPPEQEHYYCWILELLDK
jgi:hypothetical protein